MPRFEASEDDLTRVPVPVWQDTNPAPTLYIPRALVTEEQFWQFSGVSAMVTAAPRPDLPAKLRAEGVNAHNGWTAEDFAPYTRPRWTPSAC